MKLQVFYYSIHNIKHVNLNNHHIENRAMTSFRASLNETLRETRSDSESLGEIHVSMWPNDVASEVCASEWVAWGFAVDLCTVK